MEKYTMFMGWNFQHNKDVNPQQIDLGLMYFLSKSKRGCL